MDKKFIVSASPHVFDRLDTPNMMYGVSIGLLPAAIASVVLFGWKAVILIVACASACVLTEALFQKLRGKKIAVADGSAILTGILLAMVIPPDLPVWMAIVASAFAIGIGKEIFGGLGCNIFNPALLGRAFLSAAFPANMTVYSAPFSKAAFSSAVNVDAVTCATPLGLMKFEGVATNLASLFMGNVAGSVGETSAICLLLGGIYIIVRRYADWRIPLGFILTVFIFGQILHAAAPDKYPSGLFHLLAGGMMIGALFMATDPVTSPVTKLGKWVFGVGCGMLVIIIRLWGGQPEGVMYSILIMNGFTPVINILTRPRRYGDVSP
ncbi:MAG: RnfABCDGE type electron transport complex subunit D [Candidatus Omnitrophica bacterium]|nr:RnfABCDGE type electron transport complex subunit D [Candidatus Omnitrophota bacterium]